MGAFRVQVQIGDSGGQRFELVQALVDTGSTYTVVPASLLRRLGVQPHINSSFELADGTVQEREVGRALVRIDGRVEVTLVVFGPEGVEPLLGVVTLEEFLLAPDPVHEVLVPVRGLMKKM